jgi:hypothetical protein
MGSSAGNERSVPTLWLELQFRPEILRRLLTGEAAT